MIWLYDASIRCDYGGPQTRLEEESYSTTRSSSRSAHACGRCQAAELMTSIARNFAQWTVHSRDKVSQVMSDRTKEMFRLLFMR
jgi:hypothetical protein